MDLVPDNWEHEVFTLDNVALIQPDCIIYLLDFIDDVGLVMLKRTSKIYYKLVYLYVSRCKRFTRASGPNKIFSSAFAMTTVFIKCKKFRRLYYKNLIPEELFFNAVIAFYNKDPVAGSYIFKVPNSYTIHYIDMSIGDYSVRIEPMKLLNFIELKDPDSIKNFLIAVPKLLSKISKFIIPGYECDDITTLLRGKHRYTTYPIFLIFDYPNITKIFYTLGESSTDGIDD